MRHPETYDSAIAAWRKKMEAEHLAPRTVSFYVETMHAVARILQEHNRPTLPHEIRTEDAEFLLDYFIAYNFAIQTRKGYLSALRKFCESFQNPNVHQSSLRVRFPHDNRPKTDWLTSNQASELLSCPKSILQTTVIHLELCLGLRHVEVIRLLVSDIHYDDGYLDVRGKGPMGGKPRRVPFTTGTEDVLRAQERLRSDQVAHAYQRYPMSTVEPPNLILWLKAGRLNVYSEEGYGLDKVVTLPLNKLLGFHFSNHTLRRTFGRALFRAGVEVAVIAKILGHESTDVTLRYIGVDMDDMTKAMRRLEF